MSEGEERPTSVVFDHCVSVYNEMHQQSREEAGEGLIYEGHLTKLITGDLGLATPRYTAVMNHLKAMGCVEQIRRGGGGSPSRWRLISAPVEETFRSIEDMKRPTTGKFAVVEQQVRDLNRRVLALESERKFTLDTLQAMGAQLSAYTKLVTELKAQVQNHLGIHADVEAMQT